MGARPPAYWSSLAFATLLLSELLFLSVTLDTQQLDRLPSAWALVIGWSPQLVRLATTIMCVSLLLGGRDLLDTWKALAVSQGRSVRRGH